MKLTATCYLGPHKFRIIQQNRFSVILYVMSINPPSRATRSDAPKSLSHLGYMQKKEDSDAHQKHNDNLQYISVILMFSCGM